MYYYGGGQSCGCGNYGNTYPSYPQYAACGCGNSGNGTSSYAIVLVLFILLVIVIGSRFAR